MISQPRGIQRLVAELFFEVGLEELLQPGVLGRRAEEGYCRHEHKHNREQAFHVKLLLGRSKGLRISASHAGFSQCW